MMEELKPQDSCLVDIFLLNILLFTLESDTTCSLLQLLSIISFIVILSSPFIRI